MLVRKGKSGGSLVYLTRRSATARFMPGAYVFPGGTVDEADRSPESLERVTGSVAGIEAPFAIAALRELFEEAGVLVACDAAGLPAIVGPERLAAMRAMLGEGKPLARLLAEAELFLDARELVYYSNWITPEFEPLRFDTHFFIATAPDGQIASADAIEVHDGAWLAPREALARGERGELRIMFPTRKHLERLAAYDSIDALLAHARERSVAPITPFMRDGAIELSAAGEAW